MNTCYETCIPKKFQMDKKQVSHLLKFLPAEDDRGRGRPPAEPIAMLQGIFYLLRTGCQWNALPRCFGSSSTIHDFFKKLIKNNVFAKAWSDMLERYDWKVGLRLQEQSFDCSHKKAPLGGQATGCSPVDRSKIGTKEGVVTDGNGIPLAIGVAAGNLHDSRMCISVISALRCHREPPFKTIELDAAFDAEIIRNELSKRGYDYRISPNGRRKKVCEERPKHRFRWVVERTHSWLNRFRRILIRWEKLLPNFLGMMQFACFIIVSRKT